MSVVATRLLALREDSRERPNDPAQSAGLSAVELQVLSKVLKRQLKTVQDVILALGRLGGHMNRKSDGLPGWQALWEGMNMLQVYVEGSYGLIKVMRADVRGDHLGGARVVSSGWGSGQLGLASVSSMGSLRARRVKIARLPNWKQLKRRFL